MRRGKSAALLLWMAVALCGQESKLSSGSPGWKGIQVQFLTKVEPPGENARGQLPGAVIVEQGRVHHLIDDAAHKRSFGYDLLLEPSEDGNTVQLRIEPLRFSDPHYSVGPGFTLLPLPKYPVIPNLKVGDTVALDLLVNRATGQKIVDYLTLTRGETGRAAEAHDFSLADVEMSLDPLRVQVNGKAVEVPASFRGTLGNVVWMYMAGHGRFVLSLFPNEKLGFQKNGVVAANTATFHEGATEIRLECRGAIAPGSERYNLYVLHEPGWRAYSSEETFEFGAAGKAEYVVGQDWQKVGKD
jgi:hypothetical protein